MELLEYLRVQTDSAYISDLRGCTRLYSVKNALNNLDIQKYSLKEWNDAASYIADKALAFLDVEAAADYLKNLSGEQEDKRS